MIKSIKPLPKNIFEQRDALLKQVQPLESAIEDRLDYVLRKAYEICGATFDSWYVTDAAEGEVGSVDKVFYDDLICMEEICLSDLETLDVEADWLYVHLGNKHCWNLLEALPMRWMLEDFEKECAEGRASFLKEKEDKAAAKKKRSTTKQENKKKLIESAKKKLSEQERKALGL